MNLSRRAAVLVGAFALIALLGNAPRRRSDLPDTRLGQGISPSAPPIIPATWAGDSTYIVLLRLRWDLYARWKETGKWPDDSAANTALGGHGGFWAQQRKEGRAVLAGGMRGEYWDNVALIIFRAPSEADAKALVQRDPAVQAHVFQAQVRGFDISWMGEPPPKP